MDLPGPRGLPFLGQALTLDPSRMHLQLEAWHREFGDVFRFRVGPARFVAVADTELAREVLRARPDRFRRTARIESVFSEMGVKGVFSEEGEVWRKQRTVLNPAFRGSYLHGLFGTIAEVTERLRGVLDASADRDAVVDAHDLFMRFTVDVTTRVAFGYDLDTLRSGDGELQRDIKHIFAMLARRVGAAFPYWRYFKLQRDRELDVALARVRSVVDRVVAATRARMLERRARAEEPGDLLEGLLRALADEGEGARFSEDEIFGNVITLLLAGEDTTSNALAWTLHFMANDRELQRRIQAEVDEVVGPRRAVASFEAASRLVYVSAVAQEVLRLKSTAPILYFQAISDTTLGDVFLPRGTAVSLATRYIGVRPENFSEPERLWPERWLDGPRGAGATQGAEFVHQPKGHLTFGAGPRICPGRSLALTEMQIAIATIAANFDVSVPEGAPPVEEVFAFTMGPSSLRLRFTRRPRSDG